MIALAGSILVTSLIGSAHCAGMCGGFVAFYSGDGGGRRTWAHVAYNVGRLVSYLALGVVAGWVGSRLDGLGATIGIQRAAAILMGMLMVAWGGVGLLQATGRLGGSSLAPVAAHGWVARALELVHRRSAPVRALTIGLLSTLLPCGWLYAFVAVAAGTGSVLGGAVVMGAFWLGTVPVMAGLALLAQTLLGPLRRRVPVITAAILIVLGLLTIAGKMNPTAHLDHATHVHASHVGH